MNQSIDTTAPAASVPEAQEKVRPFALNLALALVYSFLAALACGVVWGLVCYWTNTNYFYIAVAIGFIVSLVATLQFSKMNIGIALLLLIPCLVFTLISVALGDFLYYTLFAAKDMQIPFAQAAGMVAGSFVEIETSSEGAGSLVMGAIGAIIGFYRAVRS